MAGPNLERGGGGRLSAGHPSLSLGCSVALCAGPLPGHGTLEGNRWLWVCIFLCPLERGRQTRPAR